MKFANRSLNLTPTTAAKNSVNKVTRYIIERIPRPWLACDRRSVAGGVAVGLFVSWLPLPLQTVLAGACAAVLRVHVPSSMVMVWFTNPLTVVPLLYAGWLVGSSILTPTPDLQNLSLSWSGIATATTHGWPVLLIGCLTCAVLTSAAGYLGVLYAMRNSKTLAEPAA